MSRNLGALTLLEPSGPAWPVMGVLYLLFYFLESVSFAVTKKIFYYLQTSSG
jgi:hypothetical protein